MRNVGITPCEWDALSAGLTVTLKRVPGDRKGEFKAGDKLDILCADIAPGKPVSVVIRHENGSQERIQARHSYTPQQIAWFRAGSALNTLSK